MKHIEFTEQDLHAAERYLTERRIVEIQFSGSTYQIRVLDAAASNDLWCFLQLDDEGLIADCFCSCENEEPTCEHLAAAWLKVYNGHLHPLHTRFSRSLWNQVCKICLSKFGDDASVLKNLSESMYECLSASDKRVFFLHLKTLEAEAYFRSLIENRVKETEETSLKFSKLTPEEITLWKEGRPSYELRYELSFWSDLAKWLMLLQDEEQPYQIAFSYSQKERPNGIKVSFPALELSCYISEANLPLIIPSLSTVASPLQVYSFDEEAIEFIHYDNEEQCFRVYRKESRREEELQKKPLEEAEEIGDWLYAKKKGFYAKEQNFLFSSPIIPKESIEKALNDHEILIERYLTGTKIFRDPIKASYSLELDSEGNLRALCYVNEPGDLLAANSALFGRWVYLEGEGFYPIEGVRFSDVETWIPLAKLSDFVSKNRVWLNTIDGFHTHLASVDAHLAYQVNEEGLRFYSQTDFIDTLPLSRDLGDWIYVQGEGFYAKRYGRLGAVIQPGVEVKPHEISLFIHLHYEELETVRGFFSTRSPINRLGLSIKLVKDSIVINPTYHLRSGYQLKDLHFFDDIIYVKKEGFHLLPMENRLPKRFRQKMIIPKDQAGFFIANELQGLRPFIIEIDKRLEEAQDIRLELHEIVREDGGGLSTVLSYHTLQGDVPLGEIFQAVKRGQEYLFTDAGRLNLDLPHFAWMRQLKPSQMDLPANRLRLSTMEMMRLQVSQEIVPLFPQANESSQEVWQSLCSFTAPTPPDYSELQSHLRPYQEAGIQWLWFLYYHGLAGLLCDDMGLGKTHQAMALLASVTAALKKTGKKAHFLVVCPTSVIYHWEDKLKEFLPHLRVYTFYGSSRSLDSFAENFDVVLTSYGVLRMESAALSDVPFEVAIYDEAQVAKNHLSRTYKALLSIQSKTRIGLTGTPIENRVRELKALFDVVLPSYMPSETQYREQFVIPIEKQHDLEAKELLARFIKPFILRRKKTDVLRDLPEKTEERAYCSLSADQEQLYQNALVQAREKVLTDLEDESKPIPYLSLFALLTKLKQICDHPAVALGASDHYQNYQSGKWDLFLELLSEARESQQKVVVFSHYLSMMDIIEAHLTAHQIGFASIRGGTANRREELRRFQEEPSCEVFIGSLQAVGLGVDLTAASVVIHYDRWWNAARENQATDRVHRIGQQRGVQVFKLITKKTIEEHIDRLIEKKGQLMEEIVGSDDENQLKLLSRKEWLDLLKIINE